MAKQVKTMQVRSDTALATTTTEINDQVTFDISTLPNGITYTGLKAVLSFANPVEWNKNSSYDSLTIVWDETSYATYASKRPVPSGIELSNETYWIKIADGNAQIEIYRQEVEEIKEFISQFDYTYPSTAAMVADSDNLAIGDKVKVYGYSVFNDGGECEYEIASEAATDISVPVGSLFANHIFSENSLNSKTVGLFPTDTQTDQINLLNDLLSASSEKGFKILFDPGTYYFSSVIIPENASIKGTSTKREYPGAVFATAGAQADTFITLNGRYASFENIMVKESTNSVRTNGVIANGAIFGYCKNISIEGFDNSFTLTNIWNFLVDDILCMEYRIQGFGTLTLVNNTQCSNVHCTCTETNPETNFSLLAGNALSLMNPTSEGNGKVHFSLNTIVRGLTIVSPHMENGQTVLKIVNGPNIPSGSVTIVGGIFMPYNAISSIVSNNSKFVEAPINMPLYSLTIQGLQVNSYDNNSSTFLPDDYFIMQGVQNLNHAIAIKPENYTTAYGTMPCRIKNGVGMSSAYPISTFGANQGLNGGDMIVQNGKAYEYSFVKKINGTLFPTAQEIAVFNETNQFAVNVKIFQNYSNFDYEQQYAEYMVMVSKNGTLLQKEIVSSDNFTPTFTYSDSTLKVSCDDNYGNYSFECTVITVSNFG